MKSKTGRYCSSGRNTDCPERGHCRGCPDNHRKYPTPEQFKEEYGIELPDNFPVWWRWWSWDNQECTEGHWEDWRLVKFGDLPTATKTGNPDKCHVVCACTPWPEPPMDWRPE